MSSSTESVESQEMKNYAKDWINGNNNKIHCKRLPNILEYVRHWYETLKQEKEAAMSEKKMTILKIPCRWLFVLTIFSLSLQPYIFFEFAVCECSVDAIQKYTKPLNSGRRHCNSNNFTRKLFDTYPPKVKPNRKTFYLVHFNLWFIWMWRYVKRWSSKWWTVNFHKNKFTTPHTICHLPFDMKSFTGSLEMTNKIKWKNNNSSENHLNANVITLVEHLQ